MSWRIMLWTIMVALLASSHGMKLKELFHWKTLDFAFERSERANAGYFLPNNSIPSAIAVWQKKMFIAIPRVKSGVPYTLCTVSIPEIRTNISSSPLLTPYPNKRANQHTGSARPANSTIHPQDKPDPENSPMGNVVPTRVLFPGIDRVPQENDPIHNQKIPTRNQLAKPEERNGMYNQQSKRDTILHSVYSMKVDDCNRLWVIDSGIVQGQEVALPQIIIYSLDKNDLEFRKFVIPPKFISDDSLFANIFVDIRGKSCDDAYAYVTDMKHSLLVYDLKTDKAWKIRHPYFNMDPFGGEVKIEEKWFDWDYGLYGLTLTKAIDGTRLVYFNPLASTSLFKVSSNMLQNASEGIKSTYDRYYHVGDKGPNGQTGASVIKHDVMFYTQINKASINCWNLRKSFEPKNFVPVVTHSNHMVYPADVIVDHHHLWALSTQFPVFIEDRIALNPNVVNFRVFVASTDKLIAGTACSSSATINALSSVVLGVITMLLTK